MNDRTLQFPRSFEWGVATSAYQIEEATTADGEGWFSAIQRGVDPGRGRHRAITEPRPNIGAGLAHDQGG